MTEPIRITAPLTDAVIEKLRAGDKVLITGVMYTTWRNDYTNLERFAKEAAIRP